MSNCGSIEIGGGDPPEEPDEITILSGGANITGGVLTTSVTYESNVLDTGIMTVYVGGEEVGTRVISVDEGVLTSELDTDVGELPFGSSLPVLVEIDLNSSDGAASETVAVVENPAPDPGDATITDCSASIFGEDLVVGWVIDWPGSEPIGATVFVQVDGVLVADPDVTLTTGTNDGGAEVDGDTLPIGEDMPVEIFLA